jgi:spermidine/putrescine transport system substrate-binding protein
LKFKSLVYVALGAALIFAGNRILNRGAVAGESSPRELNLYAMSDYFPAEVIAEFEKQTNSKVRYDNFSNNEELLAKLQAGATGYDVIVPSDYMVTALIANNLLLPINAAKLPNLSNLGAEFRNLAFDPKAEFSVPYMWGTTGVVYNSKFVKDPQESWDLLFKAEFKGRVSLLEDTREAIGIAMRKLGYSANSTSKAELAKAEDLFSKLKPNIRIYTTDPKQHLASEDVWIAQTYSGDAAVAASTKPEMKYFVPHEGATLWIDNLAIPAGARNEELAHQFINFILEPRIAKVLTEKLFYSTPNGGAEALVADENLRASHIKKLKNAKLELLKDLGSDMQLWDEAWTKIKSN